MPHNFPRIGEVNTETADELRKIGLLPLDAKTISQVRFNYGCSERQARRLIEAQRSSAAMETLMRELATERQAQVRRLEVKLERMNIKNQDSIDAAFRRGLETALVILKHTPEGDEHR